MALKFLMCICFIYVLYNIVSLVRLIYLALKKEFSKIGKEKNNE